MKSSISLLVGAALTLMTCGSSQAGTKQAPEANLDGCISAVHLWSITFKHEIASFMGVSQERMPALFCQRIAEGIRSGRISYSDINRLQLDQPTEIWLVIKGKSKAAAAATPAPQTSGFRTCYRNNGAFQIPASQKCPLSGHAQFDQPTKIDMKGKSKVATPAPRNPKFRTCNGTTGTFQIPVSRKCPLSGYAND
ncbi:hypothetical protein [Mesorhizobium australafricanum]|uniref:Uncharacterized protein n=1 Tax=Mesorhizobium australafricanum TaxID=3072311 RepID=A0ABU4X6Q3_9HYPH|nr:hypothetical protein [Mesorhizobium sp. VK3E]MDX8442792.1 hypothetical protein [Mesorhizobium sp. VK3E]